MAFSCHALNQKHEIVREFPQILFLSFMGVAEAASEPKRIVTGRKLGSERSSSFHGIVVIGELEFHGPTITPQDFLW